MVVGLYKVLGLGSWVKIINHMSLRVVFRNEMKKIVSRSPQKNKKVKNELL